MKPFKLAFIGMGSIGRRHLLNVCACLEQEGTPYSIDLYRSGDRVLPSEIETKSSNQYSVFGPIPTDTEYDAVFVTNPTSKHWETVQKFAPAARAMFIEKPVFHREYLDLNELGLRPDGIYYVACPLRYHPVIEYVSQNIPCQEAYAVRAISSSYLPDWRPGVDYRTCYSAHQELGGGVDIDLIHEWDYLSHLFGEVVEGAAIRTRLSHLEIDSNDIAVYIARTKRAVVELHLDYFGRKSLRTMQIFLPEETVDCDILNGTVTYLREGKTVTFASERDTYQMKEIRHFLNLIRGRCPNTSRIEDGLRMLRYAKGVFFKSCN